jgi:hypothetical protein
MSKYWNLQIEMSEFGCVNIESWNLKSLCEMAKRNLKFSKLNCLNIQNSKLKCLNIKYWKLKCLNVEICKLKCMHIEIKNKKPKYLIQTCCAYGHKTL